MTLSAYLEAEALLRDRAWAIWNRSGMMDANRRVFIEGEYIGWCLVDEQPIDVLTRYLLGVVITR